MPKQEPLHRIIEQSVVADDISALMTPNTIIWAKLRGYPWWPGRVKSLDGAPAELANIARTQYKAGTVVAVYFFGSHDLYDHALALSTWLKIACFSSLVPADCLRPLEPNWSLFSTRSGGARFQRALIEARNPEKYLQFERAQLKEPSRSTDPESSSASVGTYFLRESSDGTFAILESEEPKRKRGRPPKHRSTVQKADAGVNARTPAGDTKKNVLRMKNRPARHDTAGVATQDHILYCRIKLQKILLRQQLKPMEIPIAAKILTTLGSDKISLEKIKATNIGRVLRLALMKSSFSSQGQFPELGELLSSMLASWRENAENYLYSIGL